ncbi:radical SAM protein [bacterium]|nr:radical SAM protein [bacterium]
MKKHSISYHIRRMPYYRRLVQMAWNYHLRKRAQVRYAPYRLWIEPTNRCNLNCVMCPNAWFGKAELGNMDMKLYRKLIDEAAGFVYDINLHHRGEPTLHPELPEMIRYAKRRQLSVKLHTNATTLTEKTARSILEAAPDLISFSFDGYEAEAYENIRRGARFDRTLSRIFGFLEMKRARGMSKPKTVMEIMDFETVQTVPEIKERFTDRLMQAGLDRLIVKQPHNWGGQLKLDDGSDSVYVPCTFPWHALVVLWNGQVGPCPHDFFGKIHLGDANRQNLREIFQGNAIGNLREKMLGGAGILEPPCTECDSIRRKQMCGIPMASLKYIKE